MLVKGAQGTKHYLIQWWPSSPTNIFAFGVSELSSDNVSILVDSPHTGRIMRSFGIYDDAGLNKCCPSYLPLHKRLPVCNDCTRSMSGLQYLLHLKLKINFSIWGRNMIFMIGLILILFDYLHWNSNNMNVRGYCWWYVNTGGFDCLWRSVWQINTSTVVNQLIKSIHFNVVIDHDDVIKWKHILRYWPFVRGIHRWPAISLHKGQWRRALVFSLICVWINGCVNNGQTGDLTSL